MRNSFGPKKAKLAFVDSAAVVNSIGGAGVANTETFGKTFFKCQLSIEFFFIHIIFHYSMTIESNISHSCLRRPLLNVSILGPGCNLVALSSVIILTDWASCVFQLP